MKYFFCHRDGTYDPTVISRQKLLKSQGSNKIGGSCPSEIIYKETKVGEGVINISVVYISTHCGHDDNTGRLTLNKNERAALAGK